MGPAQSNIDDDEESPHETPPSPPPKKKKPSPPPKPSDSQITRTIEWEHNPTEAVYSPTVRAFGLEWFGSFLFSIFDPFSCFFFLFFPFHKANLLSPK